MMMMMFIGTETLVTPLVITYSSFAPCPHVPILDDKTKRVIRVVNDKGYSVRKPPGSCPIMPGAQVLSLGRHEAAPVKDRERHSGGSQQGSKDASVTACTRT